MYMLGAGAEPMAQRAHRTDSENAARYDALASVSAQMGAERARLRAQKEAMLAKLGFDSTQAEADRGLKREGMAQHHEEFGQDLAARNDQFGQEIGVKKEDLGLKRDELGQRNDQFNTQEGRLGRVADADIADKTVGRGLEANRDSITAKHYQASDALLSAEEKRRQDSENNFSTVLDRYMGSQLKARMNGGGQMLDRGPRGTPGTPAPDELLKIGPRVDSPELMPQFASVPDFDSNPAVKPAGAQGDVGTAIGGGGIPSDVLDMILASKGIDPTDRAFKRTQAQQEADNKQKLFDLDLKAKQRADSGELSPGQLRELNRKANADAFDAFNGTVAQGYDPTKAAKAAAAKINNMNAGVPGFVPIDPATLMGQDASPGILPSDARAMGSKLFGKDNPREALEPILEQVRTRHNEGVPLINRLVQHLPFVGGAGVDDLKQGWGTDDEMKGMYMQDPKGMPWNLTEVGQGGAWRQALLKRFHPQILAEMQARGMRPDMAEEYLRQAQ